MAAEPQYRPQHDSTRVVRPLRGYSIYSMALARRYLPITGFKIGRPHNTVYPAAGPRLRQMCGLITDAAASRHTGPFEAQDGVRLRGRVPVADQ